MDTPIKLTTEELDRYAPYHMWTEFGDGYTDYILFVLYGHNVCRRPDGESLNEQVGGQAYDRGAECAMRRRQKEHRDAQVAQETAALHHGSY